MENDNSALILEQKILEDARGEIDSILSRARQQAEAKLNAARSEAAMLKKSVLAKARLEAEGKRVRILSAVELETRKAALLAREKLVEKVFQEARRRERQFRTSEGYWNQLKELIAEGVLSLDRPEAEVLIGTEDDLRSGKAMATEIENHLRDKYSRRVKITLRPELPGDEPGAVVRSPDGRLIFNNTYSAREARTRPELRRMIYEQLFPEADRGDLFRRD